MAFQAHHFLFSFCLKVKEAKSAHQRGINTTSMAAMLLSTTNGALFQGSAPSIDLFSNKHILVYHNYSECSGVILKVWIDRDSTISNYISRDSRFQVTNTFLLFFK